MSSENMFASFLEDSFADIDGDVESYSSKLKDALETLSQSFDEALLQQALQDCLPSCPDNLLDEQVFKGTLPVAHRLLLEAFKRIDEIIPAAAEQDTSEDVKRQLLVCHGLLTVWERSMERVSKLHKTTATNLKSLSESVPATLRVIFQHCKMSQAFYGTLFEGVSEKLTGLFRKAKTILNLFLATLDGVIVFGTDTESETGLLVKVIDGIGSLVTIAHELDLKTYVDTSKTFDKLAITYQHHVIRVQPTSVTLHLEKMTRNVSSMLLSLQKSLDRVDERKVKVISHSIKILDRLFAAYSSCINNESLPCVIELLLQMLRCSPSCLQKSRVEDKVIELINGHISRGSEPFLNTVFKISDFKQTFFEHRSLDSVNKLGYHLLTISVMKKLINMPYEQHCKWTLGAESIIDVALKNISTMQGEICTGEVRLPGAHDIGERPRQATLYEATLVPICGLISQIPVDGFHAVELILLKHLLSNELWSSLLSADVWCFIGRVGSSDLCVSHVKYLLKVHVALTRQRDSLEVIMLENLIGRLYNLLSEETKHSLITELDDLEVPTWLPVARFLPSRTKSFLQNRLACVVNEVPNTFAELQRQPTVQNWQRITALMSLIGKLNYTGQKNTADILCQIWNSIADTIEILEGRQMDILAEFLKELFSATQPEEVQDDTFLMFLEAVLTSLLCLPSHVKVIASHYLRSNADSFGSTSPKAASALAELNCRLLEDDNPWVRQEAFESFNHVAHMCPNEELLTIMAAAVNKKPSLNDSLRAYLQDTPYYKLRDFTDARHYLQSVAGDSRPVCHVCYRYEEAPRDEKFARLDAQSRESPAEDPRPNELDERVNKLCDELTNMLKKSNDIGESTVRRLRLLCARILDTTDSSNTLK